MNTLRNMEQKLYYIHNKKSLTIGQGDIFYYMYNIYAKKYGSPSLRRLLHDISRQVSWLMIHPTLNTFPDFSSGLHADFVINYSSGGCMGLTHFPIILLEPNIYYSIKININIFYIVLQQFMVYPLI